MTANIGELELLYDFVNYTTPFQHCLVTQVASNMKVLTCLRCMIELSLVAALICFTYLSFRKLLREDTVISQHYEEEGVDLPSVTICVKWLSTKGANASTLVEGRDLSLPRSENWTFSDFMDKSQLARSVIKYAEFRDQLEDKLTM